MQIRDGRADDVPRLLEIYNHYVEHTSITFDIEPLDLETRRAWFESFSTTGRHRLFVLEEEGSVIGYASSQPFRSRAAYDRTVEASIYLAPEGVSKGRGRALYSRLLDLLVEDPLVHRVYAGITMPNEASVGLHLALGFAQVGLFTEVGFKFGRYWDVAWFERSL